MSEWQALCSALGRAGDKLHCTFAMHAVLLAESLRMTVIKYSWYYNRSQPRAPPVSCMFQRDARTIDVKNKMLGAVGESGGVKIKYLHLGD